MSDFFQNGNISTLHQIGRLNLDYLESKIMDYSRWRPVTLVLPSLYAELEGVALPRIVEQLKKVPYLKRIIIGLDRATEKEYEQALDFFSVLPQEVKILWNDGPAISSIYNRLKEEQLLTGEGGKGRNIWTCMGYILACREPGIIAFHDCDIVTYERILLARLVYPLVDPRMEYEYSKGYYVRVTDRLHGRVTRLFVTPLIRSLRRILGPVPFLEYLDSFRYPLSGEFAMKTGFANVAMIPSTWGIEMGMLGEVYRNYTQRRICQVDLSIDYEHKHQELSQGDPTKGLMKMCVDIALALFSTLAAEGISFSAGMFRSLKVTYQRIALDFVRVYEDDATINGLIYDRHGSIQAVETFTRSLELSGSRFLNDPLGVPPIPSWARVTAAFPSILDELKAAVDNHITL